MQVAVLGLGRFGSQVVLSLASQGHEVLAIDTAESEVQRVADHAAKAAIADMTDEVALRDLGVQNMDAGVVATGLLEASLLATMNLQRLGVSRIYAKAGSDQHATILSRIGATRVVEPEKDGGERFAHLLRLPGALDYLSLTEDYGITVEDPPVGSTDHALERLVDDGSTRRLLMVVRGGQVLLNPALTEEVREGDRLVFSGTDEDLAKRR